MGTRKRWYASLGKGPLPAALIIVGALLLRIAPESWLALMARAFLWQWAIVCILLAIWWALLRRPWLCGAALMAALICWLGTGNKAPAALDMRADTPLFRVAQMNILQENKKHEKVTAAALSTGADVICLQEVDPRWAAVLDNELGEHYPYRRTVAGTNKYGIALYSKYPLEHSTVIDLVGRPAILADIRTELGDLRLLCAHTSSPGSPASMQERNAQLRHIAAIVDSTSGPVVVMGDLNTVSWDPAMHSLVADTELGAHPEGPWPTWPTLFGFSMIPLDHILISRDLAFGRQYALRIPGSDHKGLVAEIREGNLP